MLGAIRRPHSWLGLQYSLPDPDLGLHRHPRPQFVPSEFTRFKNNLHRDSLNHLDIVAGCVLRGKQAEARATRARNTVDVTAVFTAISVHVNIHRLSGAHTTQLVFLEV